jgi:hypothetical protein
MRRGSMSDEERLGERADLLSSEPNAADERKDES